MCDRKLQCGLSLLYRITVLESGNIIVLDIMVDLCTQASNGNQPFNGPVTGWQTAAALNHSNHSNSRSRSMTNSSGSKSTGSPGSHRRPSIPSDSTSAASSRDKYVNAPPVLWIGFLPRRGGAHQRIS